MRHKPFYSFFSGNIFSKSFLRSILIFFYWRKYIFFLLEEIYFLFTGGNIFSFLLKSILIFFLLEENILFFFLLEENIFFFFTGGKYSLLLFS